MSVQVLTRKTCEYFDCSEGKDIGRRKSNKTYEKCESCDGKGYIEEWVDVAALLRDSINFGV